MVGVLGASRRRLSPNTRLRLELVPWVRLEEEVEARVQVLNPSPRSFLLEEHSWPEVPTEVEVAGVRCKMGEACRILDRYHQVGR